MNHDMRISIVSALAMLVISASPQVSAAEPAPLVDDVLNMSSHWRYHYSKPSAGTIYRAENGEDLIVRERGVHKVGSGYRLEVDDSGNLLRSGGWVQSPRADSSWFRPEFDDSGWRMRREPFFPGRNHRFGHGQDENNRMSRLFIRGRFVVNDLSRATGMRLALQYRGGVVVYLNGHEIARGHIGEQVVDASTMPEDYPDEAVLSDPNRSEESARQVTQLRLRSLDGIALPVQHLRQGVNVLAIKVLASAMPHAAAAQRGRAGWATLGLQDIRLSAPRAAAVIANIAPPESVQVWTASPVLDLEAIPYADPADLVDGIPPIRLIAARNAVVSGQAVISSPNPIAGVQAEISAFTGDSGTLDVSGGNVLIRYAVRSLAGMESPVRRPDILVSRIEVPDTVQPVWLTVTVPPDAVAGTYHSSLVITIAGIQEAVSVPVELIVHDWDMPDPLDWRQMAFFVQSPHSVAWQYGVEMWSERHLELLKPSLSMLRALGNNVMHVDIGVPSFFSPEHGIITFREQAGQLVPDFAFFDRFMKLYAEAVGEPRRIVLGVWDTHLVRDPVLTVTVKSADGILENREVPMFGQPGSEEMWRLVLEGVRERVLGYGWDERAIMLGTAGDSRPSGETVEFFASIAPFARWLVFTHGRGDPTRPDSDGRVMLNTGWPGPMSPRAMSAGLQEYPYNAGWDRGNRAGGLHQGLQRGWITDWYEPLLIYAGRGILHDQSTPASFRLFPNSQVFNRSRGYARQGIDKWPVVNPHDERGTQRSMVHGTPGWGNLYRNKVRAMSAPGPDGALPTVRFEMMRQGAQDTEVRIYLESLLVDEETRVLLGDEFEAEVKALVWAETEYRQQRNPYPPFEWDLGPDWENRLNRLYELAALAQRRLR